VLSVGGLRLDPASRQVWRHGHSVDLTPRQFSLLELFMRHPGEVLSKSMILEHVWDFSFEGDPNIVEVYVCQLRRRVDEPFQVTTLRTHRGAGYCLVEED
jgi:two-component system OmpR family response regulator